MRVSTRVILILAVLASLIAFAKQGYCAANNWSQPTTDVHMCYSDISTLYGERSLDAKQWPYSHGDQSLEYPVLTGVVTYLLALPTNTANSFYFLNALFLIVLFLICAVIVYKLRPEYSYLYPLAPAGVLAFFINWDFWGIVSMLAAIYWFDRKRYDASAIALAISISTKFMPVFLLLPVVLILAKRSQIKELIRYLAVSFATFAIINLPVLITTPQAWIHFYLFNINRRADWGSLWYALRIFNERFKDLNTIMSLSMLVMLALVSYLIVAARKPIALADVSFIVMALIFNVSKVYSPQYVLWLIPLAVLAIRERRDIHAFWVWQGGEVLYYVAIWQHLAHVGQTRFGLALIPYGISIFIRIIATVYFVERLTTGLRVRLHKEVGDFRSEPSRSYP